MRGCRLLFAALIHSNLIISLDIVIDELTVDSSFLRDNDIQNFDYIIRSFK